jgi:NhaA family Na+:H+ antiporter
MFIGSLAFEDANSPYLYQDKIGIIEGSFIAALLGYFWLRKVLPESPR